MSLVKRAAKQTAVRLQRDCVTIANYTDQLTERSTALAVW